MDGPSKTDLNTYRRATYISASKHRNSSRSQDGVSLHLLTTPCEIKTKGRKLITTTPMIILSPSDRLFHIHGRHSSLNLSEDDFLTLLINPLYLKAPGSSVELSASGRCRESFFPIQGEYAVENFRSIFRRAAPVSSASSDMLDREMALLGLLIKMKNLTPLEETALQASSDKTQGIWNIEDLADHIRYHFDSPLSLDEMAARCALNASYLSRSFKNKTGTTIFAYLNRIRIEKACLLLKNSDLTITEIAFSVGYNNISFFNRMFKRTMTVTPGEYRRRILS